MRPLFILLAGIAILATACLGGDKRDDANNDPQPSAEAATARATSEPAGASPTRAAENLRWEECEEFFECASVEVPLDYDSPGSTKLAVSLLRRAATDHSRYIGPLLINPGGPGSSGRSMAMEAESYLPREITDRFDIIGFDPRGIGESAPIECGDEIDYSDVDYTPEDDGDRDHLVQISRDYAEACQSRNGIALQHMGTVNAARDIELIRLALGAEQVSYFGYSYGTLLGAAYAELYPDRVRAMVLDSAVDPTLTYGQSIIRSAEAFDRAFQAFLADCAARRACDFHSGGDPRGAYERLIGRVERTPIHALYYEDEPEVTADDIRFAVNSALYDQHAWVRLAYALVTADLDADGTVILDLAYPADEEETNYADANSAIRCVDYVWPADASEFDDLAQMSVVTAPLVGGVGVYYDLSCVYWAYEGSPLPQIDAAGSAPIVVVGATGDPATPYAWSQALASQLSAGVLISYNGYLHGVAFSNVSACIDEAVHRYLVDLTPPPPNTTCED